MDERRNGAWPPVRWVHTTPSVGVFLKPDTGHPKPNRVPDPRSLVPGHTGKAMAHLFDRSRCATSRCRTASPYRPCASTPPWTAYPTTGTSFTWAAAPWGRRLVITEATAVTPEGRSARTTSACGTNAQVEAFARITAFVHGQGCAAGVQLAHAGRSEHVAAVERTGRRPARAPAGGRRSVPVRGRSPVATRCRAR